ncbi:MAG: GIY-YIG nuclease family protein [Candidatus Komeilibacteria bacterium]|nr:GIY-YIG nuclease family protein [Candidatus Komeilibacteria bacterium]
MKSDLMYKIYWLVNQANSQTYIGFTEDIQERISYHRSGKVKSTKDFYRFRCFILENRLTLGQAIKREKYWKSCAGRKKLKKLFGRII